MITKLLEIRDHMTCIPVITIQMAAASEAQRFLLGRAGYGAGRPLVLLVWLSAGRAEYDPHRWGGRTLPAAHQFITEQFDTLGDGAVVDVEFILGETAAPKRPEREDEVARGSLP